MTNTFWSLGSFSSNNHTITSLSLYYILKNCFYTLFSVIYYIDVSNKNFDRWKVIKTQNGVYHENRFSNIICVVGILGSLAAKFVYNKFKERENDANSGHLYTYIVWTEDTASTNKNIIGSGYVVETDIHKAVDRLTTDVIKGTVESLDVTLSEALFNVPNGTIDGLCEDCSINVTMENSGIKTSDLNVSTTSFTFISFNDGLKEPEDKKDAPAEDKSYHKWVFSVYKANEMINSSGTIKHGKTGQVLACGHFTMRDSADGMTRSELVRAIKDSIPSIIFIRNTDYVYGNGKPSIGFYVPNKDMSVAYGINRIMENPGGLYFEAEDCGTVVPNEFSDIELIESTD